MLRGRTSPEDDLKSIAQCTPPVAEAPEEIGKDHSPSAVTRIAELDTIDEVHLPTSVSLGLFSACMFPNAADPPPATRKNRPAYSAVISLQ